MIFDHKLGRSAAVSGVLLAFSLSSAQAGTKDDMLAQMLSDAAQYEALRTLGDMDDVGDVIVDPKQVDVPVSLAMPVAA